MAENEVRQNKTNGQWVVFAPTRGKRPHDWKKPHREHKQLPIHDADCPFCPGNEEMLPEIIMELAGTGSDSWQTRIVPNKYPALIPQNDNRRVLEGIHLAAKAHGRHEVIIESPAHNSDIAQMTPEEIGLIVETYHRRYLELMQKSGNYLAIIFRNHGQQAGTSLLHPHSQIITIGLVPHHIRWREEEAQRYFDTWGRCVYCEVLEYEIKTGRRLLYENNEFAAFIPWAAEVPFETWIVPKSHQADFGSLLDRQKSDFAAALSNIIQRISSKLDDPDYNYVIHTAARYRADEPQLHWYLQITPRLTRRAGFEIGSGLSINPSLPEDDADYLNDR